MYKHSIKRTQTIEESTKRLDSRQTNNHIKRTSENLASEFHSKKIKHESNSKVDPALNSKQLAKNLKEESKVEESSPYLESDPKTWKIFKPEVIATLKSLGVTSLRANQFTDYVLVVIEGTDTTTVFGYLQDEIYKRDVVVHNDYTLANKDAAIKRTVPVF